MSAAEATAAMAHAGIDMQKANLAQAAASLGIDFSRFGMDEPVDARDSQAIRSNVEAIAASLGVGWTKRMLIDRFILGSRQPFQELRHGFGADIGERIDGGLSKALFGLQQFEQSFNRV